MRGYIPGEQPQDSGYIKLNTNENPYPPTPLIKSTLKNFDIDLLRRYPDPTADGLRQLVASRLDVTADNVLVTNGGDEGLRYRSRGESPGSATCTLVLVPRWKCGGKNG